MNARTTALLVLLGGSVLLLMLSRTRPGQVAVAAATESLMSGIVGYRLNNPLNVERGDPWQGLSSDQPHPRFAKFVSVPYGIRAASKILQTYRSKYGINTVRGIVDRWNPKADGQPLQYAPNVASALGVDVDAVIDVRSRDTAFRLMRAMIRQEIGAAAALLVTDADVHAGLTLAGVQ